MIFGGKMPILLGEKHIATNGIQLHVMQAGPEDGTLVVLLHGFPELWFGWRNQIHPLAEAGFRVWVPDQRGYNLSSKPLGVASYHITTLTHDIIGLIKAAGQEQAIIVGHDWGAAVAWNLATYYPEWVAKLVIMNVPHPAVMMRTLRRSFSQLRKSWYMFFFQIPRLPEWVLGRNNAQGASDLLRRSGKPGTFSDEDLAYYRQAWNQPGALTAMLNWYRSMVRSGFRISTQPSVRSSRVAAPTLLLWGKQDVALSHEMAQPSIDLCDDGQLVFFDQATHWVQHDEAEAVNQLLLDFLLDPSSD
jgi:pimeloyl-ACP methyl ester carboxylesterase